MTRINSKLTFILIGIAIFMSGMAAIISGGASNAIQVLCFFILPPLPFLILAILAQFKKDISVNRLIGTACGAAVAIIIPFTFLFIDSIGDFGGGANIGLGLLFLAMPILIPALAAAGYFCSRLISSK